MHGFAIDFIPAKDLVDMEVEPLRRISEGSKSPVAGDEIAAKDRVSSDVR